MNPPFGWAPDGADPYWPAQDPAAPVLVLRALGLGDGLTAVPSLRGLRRLLPGRLIVLAMAHPVARLLHGAGVVDRVLPARGLGEAPPGLALGRHLAVNLHGRGPQSHRTLLAGSPQALLAFDCPQAGVPGPPWRDPRLDGEHEIARWCRLVEWAGGRCDPTDLRLPRPVVVRPRGLPAGEVAGGETGFPPTRDVVVLHPGAASGSRRWPAERWVRVAAALAARGMRVVVTGSAGEQPLCAQVVAGARLPAGADLAGRISLDRLAALVASAGLLICGDTGVAHLATAYRTRSVLLFGPTSPAAWGPTIDPHLHVTVWHGDAEYPGDPHAATPDPALLRITEHEVLRAVDAVQSTPTQRFVPRRAG